MLRFLRHPCGALRDPRSLALALACPRFAHVMFHPLYIGLQATSGAAVDPSTVDVSALGWSEIQAQLLSQLEELRAADPVSLSTGLCLVKLGNAARLHNKLAEAER